MKIESGPQPCLCRETFTVTVTAMASGQILGWSDTAGQQRFLADALKATVIEKLQQFYQCHLHHAVLSVTVHT